MAIFITRKESCLNRRDHKNLRTLFLRAEVREKARQRLCLVDGTELLLQLPRGSCLNPGDILYAQGGEAVAIVEAEPEPVYTLHATDPFPLMRAAYHLGNRHVAMELAPGYLRIKPDHVLAHLIEQLGGVRYTEEMAPFLPDNGAYRSHGHTHA